MPLSEPNQTLPKCNLEMRGSGGLVEVLVDVERKPVAFGELVLGQSGTDKWEEGKIELVNEFGEFSGIIEIEFKIIIRKLISIRE